MSNLSLKQLYGLAYQWMVEKEQKLDPQDNPELHTWLNNDAQTVAEFLDFVWKHKEGKRAESP